MAKPAAAFRQWFAHHLHSSLMFGRFGEARIVENLLLLFQTRNGLGASFLASTLGRTVNVRDLRDLGAVILSSIALIEDVE